MRNVMHEYKIKWGMPSVDEAQKKLFVYIDWAAGTQVRPLKIIHGWGSSGVGGKLKDAVRSWLDRLRAEGKVTRIIIGENWYRMHPTARDVLHDYPELERDEDLADNADRCNKGITIIEVCHKKAKLGSKAQEKEKDK